MLLLAKWFFRDYLRSLISYRTRSTHLMSFAQFMFCHSSLTSSVCQCNLNLLRFRVCLLISVIIMCFVSLSLVNRHNYNFLGTSFWCIWWSCVQFYFSHIKYFRCTFMLDWHLFQNTFPVPTPPETFIMFRLSILSVQLIITIIISPVQVFDLLDNHTCSFFPHIK